MITDFFRFKRMTESAKNRLLVQLLEALWRINFGFSLNQHLAENAIFVQINKWRCKAYLSCISNFWLINIKSKNIFKRKKGVSSRQPSSALKHDRVSESTHLQNQKLQSPNTIRREMCRFIPLPPLAGSKLSLPPSTTRRWRLDFAGQNTHTHTPTHAHIQHKIHLIFSFKRWKLWLWRFKANLQSHF